MTAAYIAQFKAQTAALQNAKPPVKPSQRGLPERGMAVPQKRKANKHEEDALQTSIMRWFALQYPEYVGMLFAVPNGGRRDAREGARLKKQGVTAGVSDLILLVPRPQVLLLEVKVKGGKLSDAQKTWLAKATALGHSTAVAYDFNAARAAIVSHIGY